MTKYEIHTDITKAVLSPTDSEEDILLFMVLLHTHSIQLKCDVKLEDVIQRDHQQGILLPAITQRHAAEAVASLWPPTQKRGNYEYWYGRYNSLTPYEVVSEIPPEQLERVRQLRELLLEDSRIEQVCIEN